MPPAGFWGAPGGGLGCRTWGSPSPGFQCAVSAGGSRCGDAGGQKWGGISPGVGLMSPGGVTEPADSLGAGGLKVK